MRRLLLPLAYALAMVSPGAEAGIWSRCKAALVREAAPAPIPDRIANFGGNDGDLQHSFLPLYAAGDDSSPIAADAWQDAGYDKIAEALRGNAMTDAAFDEWETTNWCHFWKSLGADVQRGRLAVPEVVMNEAFAVRFRPLLRRGFAPSVGLWTSGKSRAFHEATLSLNTARAVRLLGPMTITLLQHYNVRRSKLPSEGRAEHHFGDDSEVFLRFFAPAAPHDMPEYLEHLSKDAARFFSGLGVFENLRFLEISGPATTHCYRLHLTGPALRAVSNEDFASLP